MSTIGAERPQFYEGQYLGADDLQALTDYQRGQAARDRLGGHVWGIAMGLQLKEVASAAGGGQVDVYVQPGYAWDGFGRPVVVLSPYQLPAERFKQITTTGPVKVWLRYSQTQTGAPAPGFETCQSDGSYGRVVESFDLAVGDLAHAAQHDRLSIAGESVDAMEALHHLDSGDPLVCDESIPFQILPSEESNPRWLIPLGYVTWEPGAAGLSGRFKETTDEATLKRSRAARIYTGVVAESVLAADGVIRLRERGMPAPVGGAFSSACEQQALDDGSERDLVLQDEHLKSVDLVWVEGSLRALGDVKLFGSKVDFRDDAGDAGTLWLQRIADNTPGPGGLDLQAVIGAEADGKNRFAVGPAGEADGDPLRTRFTVLDSGEVGIGLNLPEELLHLKGSDDPTLRLEVDSNGAASGRLAFRQSDGIGADLYYDDSAAIDGLAVDTVNGGASETRLVIKRDGRLGVGTTTPDHDLQIGDASATVSLSLRGPDGDSESSFLAFEDDEGTGSRWFRIIHDTDANTLRIASANSDPILTCQRIGGNVGIGTATPGYGLEVRRHLAGGFSVGLGGDSGRIRSDYLNLSPNLIFYDRDEAGGVIRFREGPVHNDEANPEFEALIAGRRGHIGIGTENPQESLDVNGRIIRKGQPLTQAGSVNHNATLSVPWGTTADWNLFVAPRVMGEEEANSEADNALLKLECFATVQSTTSWLITARYKFKYWNDNPRNGVWHSGSANYLLVPR